MKVFFMSYASPSVKLAAAKANFGGEVHIHLFVSCTIPFEIDCFDGHEYTNIAPSPNYRVCYATTN